MELKNIDIEKLMDLAASGDNMAFREIYENFFTPVYKYVLTRTKRDDLAKDISQTVFLKSFKNIKRYKYQGKSPLAYFFTIAKNEIINDWRKNKNNQSINNLEERIKVEDTTERKTEDSLRIDKVKSAIESLTEDQKELISLKFISGLDNSEISEIIDKSEEAIRQMQFRALKAIKEKIKENE
ncbi:MAG: RNA polymerase sigma factor [Candidatus Pacebacteria bacterium]|nr:RNA polymerase sigma factor [Candidatus Paceibacterota bacterium]